MAMKLDNLSPFPADNEPEERVRAASAAREAGAGHFVAVRIILMICGASFLFCGCAVATFLPEVAAKHAEKELRYWGGPDDVYRDQAGEVTAFAKRAATVGALLVVGLGLAYIVFGICVTHAPLPITISALGLFLGLESTIIAHGRGERNNPAPVVLFLGIGGPLIYSLIVAIVYRRPGAAILERRPQPIEETNALDLPATPTSEHMPQSSTQ
jgi:hypothetical protein